MKRYSERRRRAQLIKDQDGRCFYCAIPVIQSRSPLDYPPAMATIDHLLPRSKGGKRRAPNEVCACLRCNQARGTSCWLLFYLSKERERIVNMLCPVLLVSSEAPCALK